MFHPWAAGWHCFGVFGEAVVVLLGILYQRDIVRQRSANLFVKGTGTATVLIEFKTRMKNHF